MLLSLGHQKDISVLVLRFQLHVFHHLVLKVAWSVIYSISVRVRREQFGLVACDLT